MPDQNGKKTVRLAAHRLGNGLKPLLFAFAVVAGLLWLYRNGFELEKIIGSAGEVSPFHFLIAMSFLPVIGFPISAFYLLAGVAYHWAVAWGLCTLSLAINVTVSYCLTRYLLRDPLERFLLKKGYDIPKISDKNQFRMTFLMRTVPGPPFPLQNYMLSLAEIKFPLYFFVSVSTQSLFAIGMISISNQIVRNGNLVKCFVFAGIIGLLFLFKKHFSKSKASAEWPDSESAESKPK